MKKIIFSLALLTCLICASCESECQPPACYFPTLPPGEFTCQAIFLGWFYNNSTGECEFIMYTGCIPGEYSTQADCETFCICD